MTWTDTVSLVPYLGVYGDYYFTQDDASAIVAAGGIPFASTPLLEGWSARVTGGIGSNFQLWTFKAKGQVPF